MSITTEFTKDQAIPNDASPDLSTLTGKSIVLTGGASGIGEQYMRSFVAAGAFVTFSDLAVDRGEKLANELLDKVAFVPGDVLVWQDQVKLFKTALEKSPSKTIDIVIANAGIGEVEDDVLFHKEHANGELLPPALNTLNVNLTGVFYTVKLALYHFPKQPEGEGRDRCIIMTSSLSGYLDHKGAPQYNASKHGVRGIMKSVRRSGPEQKIRINLIAPWYANAFISKAYSADSAVGSYRLELVQKSSGIKQKQLELSSVRSRMLAWRQCIWHLTGPSMVCTATCSNVHALLMHTGRALGIVPRSLGKRGYYDLEKDDWNDGDYLAQWMRNPTARPVFQS